MASLDWAAPSEWSIDYDSLDRDEPALVFGPAFVRKPVSFCIRAGMPALMQKCAPSGSGCRGDACGRSSLRFVRLPRSAPAWETSTLDTPL